MKSIARTAAGTSLLALVAALALTGPGQAAGVNGTTLSGYKTIDICDTGTNLGGIPQWRYSGEISVANGGAVATTGLNIYDAIQNKVGAGQFADVPGLNQTVVNKGSETPVNLLPNTQQTFQYSIQGKWLPLGPIRNRAKITITNHSGYLNRDFGPEPKATWSGTDATGANKPELCDNGDGDEGCTLTQGYWKNHTPWPSPYDPDAPFYLSGSTWMGVFNTTPGGSGYYILAHQFMAAELNVANGAGTPSGVQAALNDAQAFFAANTPAVCTPQNFNCNQQKATAKVLDDYNNGVYAGGPPHCGG
jgi:hypothetical protein